MRRYADDLGHYAYTILQILNKTKLEASEEAALLKEHHIIYGVQDNFHSIVSDGKRHAESWTCLDINTGGSKVDYAWYDIDLNDPRNQ